MNQHPLYIVFDPDRPSTERWLALSGPAAYPVWNCYGTHATPMTFARAHAFASAYGSKRAVVVGVERAGDEAALMIASRDAASHQLQEATPWAKFL